MSMVMEGTRTGRDELSTLRSQESALLEVLNASPVHDFTTALEAISIGFRLGALQEEVLVLGDLDVKRTLASEIGLDYYPTVLRGELVKFILRRLNAFGGNHPVTHVSDQTIKQLMLGAATLGSLQEFTTPEQF